MAHSGPSNVSQASLVDLKAITAEHVHRFAAEGRSAVKGAPRRPHPQHESKLSDKFERPSPGLIKRLAEEARNEAKQRHFQDDGSGPTDEQRHEIFKKKAKKYAALKRGDFSQVSERELSESVLDLESRWDGETFSSGSSDVDESATVSKPHADESSDEEDDNLSNVEYMDEMGRTRIGTRKAKREAERAMRTSRAVQHDETESEYGKVLQSQIIHGDQNMFPVYEPDADALRAKYLAAQEEARAHRYDSTKEVRARGAGLYQFSLDEEKRAEQMASLSAQRNETEQARNKVSARGTLSAAQETKKRKVDERRAMIEAKRAKLMGGEDEVRRRKALKETGQAEDFLDKLHREFEEQQ